MANFTIKSPIFFAQEQLKTKIKTMGEISTENLLKLEMIFEYEPDKQNQHSLGKMVEDHEQRVKQRTKELEQARLQRDASRTTAQRSRER